MPPGFVDALHERTQFGLAVLQHETLPLRWPAKPQRRSVAGEQTYSTEKRADLKDPWRLATGLTLGRWLGVALVVDAVGAEGGHVVDHRRGHRGHVVDHLDVEGLLDQVVLNGLQEILEEVVSLALVLA